MKMVIATMVVLIMKADRMSKRKLKYSSLLLLLFIILINENITICVDNQLYLMIFNKYKRVI